MKTKVWSIILAAGLSAISVNSAWADIAVPDNVASCYRSIYSDILAWKITDAKVREYVNPDNVLADMRNPINDHLRWKVLKSTKKFVRFLLRKINEEGWNYDSNDVEFTKYHEWSHKILLQWKIWKYNFKLYLESGGECKVLNFVVAGVKWMRDGIPKM